MARQLGCGLSGVSDWTGGPHGSRHNSKRASYKLVKPAASSTPTQQIHFWMHKKKKYFLRLDAPMAR